jgi:hypothetical protein
VEGTHACLSKSNHAQCYHPASHVTRFARHVRGLAVTREVSEETVSTMMVMMTTTTTVMMLMMMTISHVPRGRGA